MLTLPPPMQANATLRCIPVAAGAAAVLIVYERMRSQLVYSLQSFGDDATAKQAHSSNSDFKTNVRLATAHSSLAPSTPRPPSKSNQAIFVTTFVRSDIDTISPTTPVTSSISTKCNPALIASCPSAR